MPSPLASLPGSRALIALLLLLLTACGKEPSTITVIAPAATTPSAPQKPRTKPMPFTPPVPKEFPRKGTKLTPDALRRLLLRDDVSVLQSLEDVYKAKEGVALAHANLLPSFNISAMLGGGTFGLGGITFLLPFLAPSNWYNLDTSKRQLAASGYAFYLVELNQYASVYSLYLTMLADQEIEKNQQIHYGNIEQIRRFVESQVKDGDASLASLQQAAAQSQLAHMQVLDLDKSINDSRAAIRKILGFELNRDFYLDDFHLEALPEEDKAPEAILKKVFLRSPEARQIDSLIAAAQDGTFSAGFSFLGGGPSGGMDLAGGPSPFTASGSIGFSFGIFPEVAISRIVVEQLNLRRRQIWLEEGKAIETTLSSLAIAKRQLSDAVDAEKNAREAYEAIQADFAQSRATLNDVISASELMIGASISRIATRLKVDSQRVNLERILLTRQFAAIPDCRLDQFSPRPGAWFEEIFNPGRNRATVDELCRARMSR